MTEIRGRRVLLRPFRAEEFDEVLSRRREEGLSGAQVRHVAHVVSEEALRRRLALSGTLTKTEILFALEAGGKLVGEIQARCSEEALPPGVFELGIEIYDPADRGKGHAIEGTALLTSYVFENEGAHRVQAATDVDNVAMRRVLERTGFTFEAVLRGFMPTADGPVDYAMYGLTVNDHRTASGSSTHGAILPP